MELKARKNIKSTAAPANVQDRVTDIFTGGDRDAAAAGIGAGGAAEAAGVLNAVDEDGESGEEADMPRDFEYYTSGEEEDE